MPTLRDDDSGRTLVTPPKSFGRVASKRFVTSIFGSPSTLGAEWAQARDTVKHTRRETLRAPLSLSNGDIFGLTLRFLSDMEFTTHATAVNFYSKCFTGRSFVVWAMEQTFREQTFRDEADAMFLANELLVRGIIAPVARGKSDGEKKAGFLPGLPGMGASMGIVGVGKAWKVFRGNDWTYHVKTHARSALIAACFGNSTEKEKNDIRECVGRMKTLKSLIDGDEAEEDKEDEEEDDGKERKATIAMAKDALSATGGILTAPFRRARFVLQGVGVMIDNFFSTLGPHVVVALGSLLFMVWLQNFAFACVLAAAFTRHLLWVSEIQRDALLERCRADQLKKFQMIRGDPKLNRAGAESADWWSAIFQHMWDGWMAMWMNRLLREQLEWCFESLDLPFVSKVELSEFRFGTSAPAIKTSRTFAGSDGEMIVEWDLDWTMEDSVVLVSAMFGRGTMVPIPIRIRLANIRIAGNLRLMFTWMRAKGGPYVRSLRISFVGLPSYSFSLKTFGAVNLNEIGVIHTALRRVVDDYLKSSLCEPEGYFWDVKEWWLSADNEEIIDQKELITQPLMRDIERIWKRRKDETTVEVRVMPVFVELDSHARNSSLKTKYLDGKRCRMAVAIEYAGKRVVSKSHIMKKHVEAEYNEIEHPTWDSGAFARLDTTDEVVDGQLAMFLMSESMDSNAAKATATKLLRISRKISAVGKIDNIFKLRAGDIHSVEVTLLDPKTLKSVGILHCRIRINILQPNIIVDEGKSSEMSLGKRVASMYESMSAAALNIPRGAADAASAHSRAAMKRTATCFGCFRADAADATADADDGGVEDDFGIAGLKPLTSMERARAMGATSASGFSTDDEDAS